MSREQIPWNLVAQEIMRVLGVEAARALYYAFIYYSVYPVLVELIQKIISGRARSDEVTRAVQEIQRLLQQQQAALPLQPPSDPQQLQIALAQALQRSYPQILPSGIPSAAPTYPAARPSPELEDRVRSLEREIETLESVRQDLLRKYYATFDENERKMVEQRLREIEDRLREKRTDLALLKSQIQAYR
jgi:polyhydroxyalkanoate synthesis regulator phasin